MTWIRSSPPCSTAARPSCTKRYKIRAHGGYDLKSVRAAAEARGGTLTLHWEDEWFTLRVLLPQQRT